MTEQQGYQPISQDALAEGNDHDLLQAVYEHLQRLLGDNWHPITNVELLPSIPDPAKTAWYVWWFVAEVGGSGIPGYLHNHVTSTSEVRAFHAALRAIDAREAAALLEAGIALAYAAGSLDVDTESDWFSQFTAPSDWSDESAIESRSFELLSGPVSTSAARYIRKHVAEI